MKISLVIAIVLSVAHAAFSQTPCTTDAVTKLTGTWKQKPDFLANADITLPKAQYPIALAKSQSVADLIKRSVPRPAGVEPALTRMIEGGSYVKNGPLQYGARAMVLGYYCGRSGTSSSMLLGDETETWIYINFNGLYWLINDRMSLGKELPTVDRELIFYEPKKIGEIRGFSILQPKVHTDRKEEAVIITPAGRSAYKPVSRQQFLLALKRFHEKKIASINKSSGADSGKIDEMKAKLEREKLLSQEQIDKMVATMRASQAKMSGNLDKTAKAEQDEITKIDAFIARMSEADRGRQAIIRDPSAKLESLFVGDAQGERLVTFDKSLFDPSLPRQSIQLVTVYWSWDDKNPAKNEFIRQFKEKFDFEALQRMLLK